MSCVPAYRPKLLSKHIPPRPLPPYRRYHYIYVFRIVFFPHPVPPKSKLIFRQPSSYPDFSPSLLFILFVTYLRNSLRRRQGQRAESPSFRLWHTLYYSLIKTRVPTPSPPHPLLLSCSSTRPNFSKTQLLLFPTLISQPLDSTPLPLFPPPPQKKTFRPTLPFVWLFSLSYFPPCRYWIYAVVAEVSPTGAGAASWVAVLLSPTYYSLPSLRCRWFRHYFRLSRRQGASLQKGYKKKIYKIEINEGASFRV